MAEETKVVLDTSDFVRKTIVGEEIYSRLITDETSSEESKESNTKMLWWRIGIYKLKNPWRYALVLNYPHIYLDGKDEYQASYCPSCSFEMGNIVRDFRMEELRDLMFSLKPYIPFSVFYEFMTNMESSGWPTILTPRENFEESDSK